MTIYDPEHPDHIAWLIEHTTKIETTGALLRAMIGEADRMRMLARWLKERCEPHVPYTTQIDRKMIDEISNVLEDRIES